MKDRLLILLLLSGFFFTTMLLGCSSSGGTVSQNEDQEINYRNTWTLKDYLRRQTGVRLVGTGSSIRVVIRGESTTASSSNQPLFVIDDQKVGHSFSNANELLHPGEILSVEVLPPSKAVRYGMEGHFGVIVIRTK